MRMGYLLTEDQTEKVLIMSDYMDMIPHDFMEHCIDVLWNRMNTNER